jgi:hypothetical protein
MRLFRHFNASLDKFFTVVDWDQRTVSLRTIRKILSDLVHNELAVTVDKNSADVIPHDFVVQYVVGAYMAVLTWWLDGGAKLPPQRMDAMFRRLATEGIIPSHS